MPWGCCFIFPWSVKNLSRVWVRVNHCRALKQHCAPSDASLVSRSVQIKAFTEWMHVNVTFSSEGTEVSLSLLLPPSWWNAILKLSIISDFPYELLLSNCPLTPEWPFLYLSTVSILLFCFLPFFSFFLLRGAALPCSSETDVSDRLP